MTSRSVAVEEGVEAPFVRGEIEALRLDPVVAVVGVAVALAAVADQRHQGAFLVLGPHPRRHHAQCEEVGAGRAADAPAQPPRQYAHRGERRLVGHAHHVVDDLGHEGRLDARPADAFDARAARAGRRQVAGRIALEEGRVFRIGDAQPGRQLLVADVAADRGRSAAGAGAHHDPGGDRMLFAAHLLEHRFGDVVVAAPVGGALGIGELVHVDTAQTGRQLVGGGIDALAVGHQVALPALALDLLDLLRRGAGRHHGMERQAQHAREIGLRDRRRAGRGLDHWRVVPDASVADAVEKQRARQAMLEAARRMGRFVLQVEVDAGEGRQVELQQMGVGRAPLVVLDQRDGMARPGAFVVGARRLAEQQRRGHPPITFLAIMQWMPLLPSTVWVTCRSACRLQSM